MAVVDVNVTELELLELTTDEPEPVEFTDGMAAMFLDALAQTGSVRASARAAGRLVYPHPGDGRVRQAAYERRYRDKRFRAAWNVARTRRLRSTGDELVWAIEEMDRLTHGEALDELINLAFLPDPRPRRQELDRERGEWVAIDPERLAAARERLTAAATSWMAAIARTPRERTATDVRQWLGLSPDATRTEVDARYTELFGDEWVNVDGQVA